MVCLTLVGAYACVLEEEPVLLKLSVPIAALEEVRVPTHRHLNRLPAPPRVADLVLGVVRIDKILHDAAAFEDVYLVSVGVSVCQCGDSAVGIDGGEPGRFLLVGGHVYLLGFVRKSKFGEGGADFDAVGGL